MKLYINDELVAVGGFASRDGTLLALVSMRRENGVIIERKVNFFGRLRKSTGDKWSVEFLNMENIDGATRISVEFEEADGDIAVEDCSMVADSDSDILKRARYKCYLDLKKEFE